MPMAQDAYGWLLGGLIVFGIFVNEILKRLIPPGKSKCRYCGHPIK